MPNQFGLLSSLMTVATLISVIAPLKYDYAIILAQSKKEASEIVTFVLMLSLGIIVVIYLIMILLPLEDIATFGNIELTSNYYILLTPIIAYFIIVYNCYIEWCIRIKYFNETSISKIANSSSNVLSKISLSFFSKSSSSLVLGELIGRGISATISIIALINYNAIVKLNSKKIINIALKYIKFPKYTLLDQIFSQFNSMLPILMIGYYFSLLEVGFFVMSLNLLSVPISLISFTIRDVFRQKVVEVIRTKSRCDKVYIKMLNLMVLIGIGIGIVMYFLIPIIFDILLDDNWKESSHYTMILLPSTILGLISMSLSGVLIATEKNSTSMKWQILYFILVIISFVFGKYIFNDIVKTIILFSFFRGLTYLVYIYISYIASKGKQEFKNLLHE